MGGAAQAPPTRRCVTLLASPRHIIIATNLSREIGNQLRDRPNLVYSGLRVVADPRRHYAYPDMLVSDEVPEIFDELVSLRCRLKVGGIYAKVKFD